MPNVDLIVDLRSPLNSSLIKCRPINGRTGSNLYVVFDDDDSTLDDLVPFAIRLLCIAETVRTDDCVVLDYAVSPVMGSVGSLRGPFVLFSSQRIRTQSFLIGNVVCRRGAHHR